MDPEEYRKKIEDEILQIIEEKLAAQQIDEDKASELAQYILDSLRG
jgi:acyl carrier protein